MIAMRSLPALLLVAACISAPLAPDFRDRQWTLVSVDGVASLPSGAATPTIVFDSDERVSANTGCNSAGGPYTVDGDRLTIGTLIMTRRACADPAGNDLERAYVRALEGTRRYRIVDAKLELLDEGGNVLARFR